MFLDLLVFWSEFNSRSFILIQRKKNNPKIKSKEKVRIEGTIEKKVVQLHEWTPYLIPGTIPRPQICLLGQQKVQNNLKLSQNQNSELKET